MIGDYEDDTHYCLKCHSTIIGLDNYVAHRRSNCGKLLTVTNNGPNPSTVRDDEAPNLKADDFFSSLELQSSSKKSLSHPSSGGKFSGGIQTRSKTSAVLHAATSNHKEPTASNNNISPSKQGDDWELFHNDRDSPTKVGKKEEHHHLPVAEYADSDADEESDSSELDFDESDESESEDAPPRSYTGGKWKPTSSPIQWLGHQTDEERYCWTSSTVGKWKSTNFDSNHEQNETVPPPHFTGSKWTPGKVYAKAVVEDVPPPNHTKGKWKPSTKPYENTNFSSDHDSGELQHHQKQTDSHPPVNHTKGKWKPGFAGGGKEGSGTLPPPSYTKGKWKPGSNETKVALSKSNRRSQLSSDGNENSDVSPLRKSNGSVQYWCGPCNRRLASKVVYDRHLKSELHLKRTVYDRELNESSGLNIDFMKTTTTTEKDAKSDKDEVSKAEKIETSGKARKKIYEQCKVCKSRVNTQDIGKHLISHYHCLKSADVRDLNNEMVLNNIHSVVLQSPFQCGACKYYCNTEEVFLEHWNAENHRNVTLTAGRLFSCAFCKFQTNEGDTLYAHLLSDQHRELVSVINRSVPIVIKKILPIECDTCSQHFLFNIELRKHCEKEAHAYSSTSTDDYQSKFKCSICSTFCKSLIALQRHQSVEHDEKSYICTFCSLVFNSADEIRAHRNSTLHRYAVLDKHAAEDGTGKDISKVCLYCQEKCPNMLKLKEHLKEKHHEHNHTCPLCGETFIIPQELTVHLRKKACTFKDSKKSHSCDRCQFTTNSISEFMYHNVFHDQTPLITNDDNGKELKKSVEQYKCPVCHNFYSKVSLRCHIRIHTKERPYICSICGVSFVRKNNWLFHMRNHERKTSEKKRRLKSTLNNDRPFLCSTCGASFKNRSILQQHMTRHNGKIFKCKMLNCIFEGRSLAELKLHMSSHSDQKSYACTICNYRGKTKQQLQRHFTIHENIKKYECSECSQSFRLASHLRRHEILHTKSKPFACHYCNYQCNNFENLRKHILNTQKHPGKSVYECNVCTEDDAFQTNFSKEFKVHLVNMHADRFGTGKEATTYINSLYGEDIKDIEITSSVKKTVLQGEQLLCETAIPSNLSGSTMFLMSTSHDPSEDLFLMSEGPDVVCIENLGTWNMEDTYDVEENEILVPFQSEGTSLFDEHFQ